MVLGLNTRLSEFFRLNRQLGEMQNRIANLEATSIALETDIAYANTDKAVEEWARTYERMGKEGDQVIIPAPYWVSYPDIVLLTGATPVILETREADGFKVTPDRLAGTITARTTSPFLTTPPGVASLTEQTITSPMLPYLRREPPSTLMHISSLAPVLSATANRVCIWIMVHTHVAIRCSLVGSHRRGP